MLEYRDLPLTPPVLEFEALTLMMHRCGSNIMWKSTNIYFLKACNVPHTCPEKLFGKNTVHFHAKECAEIPFPPMKINFMKDFKCEKTLGKGTEGTVYQCLSTFNRHDCAVKEVNPQNLLIRYLRCEPSDVNILTMLSHKNIIELYLAWSQQ
ncbi:hypothetical protein BS78_07G198300 [Paspalum vaginatum]|nr:hypothetical protein BS78_07G198300 [Paspalum vaginatum]